MSDKTIIVTSPNSVTIVISQVGVTAAPREVVSLPTAPKQVVVSLPAAPRAVVSLPVAPRVVVSTQGGRGTDGTNGTDGTDGTDGIDGIDGIDGTSVTMDTRINILGDTSYNGAMAYATDHHAMYLFVDGWQESSALMTPRSGPVDMGVEQTSNLSGYGADYITDKRLSNVSIGSNVNERLGGVRVVFAASLGRNLTQVYLDGAWQTVLTGVNIQTDSAEAVPDIEFTDFSPWVLSLITGNSDAKDANDVPLVQNMKIDMGAYSAPLVIDGGSF